MPLPTLTDRVLAIARAQLDEGVAESDGENMGEPSRRYMGGRCEPWCAWFVAYCFREAGAPLPGDWPPDGRANPLASVAFMERLFGEHGWLVQKPMRGDVVFFVSRDGSDSGPGRHVGLVERVALTTIDVLSGNTGDAVRRTTYRALTLPQRVTSYGRRPEP